jgi:hypothetical protein
MTKGREQLAEGFQTQNRNIPESLRLLQELQPPRPNPEDPRDPVETQLYALLGDVTLPRSLLPAIDAHSRERHTVSVQYFKEVPEKRTVYIFNNLPVPGESPQADEEMVAKEARRIFNELLSTSMLTNFRDKAQDLFSRWIKNDMRHSCLAESYYLRQSYDLWENMIAYAKDFFVFRDRATINIETAKLGEIISFVRKAVAMQGQGQPASVFFSTEETSGRSLSSNELIIQMGDERITGLRFNEFIRDGERSPLEQFFESLNPEDVAGLISLGGWEVVGPFHITTRHHEWGGWQRFEGLDASNLGKEEIYAFIGRYVSHLKTFPRKI